MVDSAATTIRMRLQIGSRERIREAECEKFRSKEYFDFLCQFLGFDCHSLVGEFIEHYPGIEQVHNTQINTKTRYHPIGRKNFKGYGEGNETFCEFSVVFDNFGKRDLEGFISKALLICERSGHREFIMTGWNGIPEQFWTVFSSTRFFLDPVWWTKNMDWRGRYPLPTL